MSLTFSPVGPALDETLDGPAWDGGGLLFCVAGRNEIHRWDETTGATSMVRSATNRARGLALGPDGRLFGAQSRARRVMWLSADGGAFYLEAMLDGERHNDPQDLVVDAGSRVWFTDRHTDSTIPGPVGYPPLAHNSVLRLEESGPRGTETPGTGTSGTGTAGGWRLERMTFDTTGPGGIALSGDERALYVIDGLDAPAAAASLRSYAIEGAGPLGPGALLHSFAPGELAGGLCTDPLGRIHVAVRAAAGVGGGRIDLLGPSGGLLASHPFDASPTNCCFGGEGSARLFVTTAEGVLLAATVDDHTET